MRREAQRKRRKVVVEGCRTITSADGRGVLGGGEEEIKKGKMKDER
jgi:hypothetical protein